MFRWIIGSSLSFRFVVIGIAAALVALGLYRLQKMPVDIFPEFAAPTVEVQTEAIGLSANEVESLVTLNLEELLSGVPWLKSIRSTSVTGLSSIVLTFERGTEVMRARQMIQERLTLAYTLPNIAQAPVILQPVSATSRFMMIEVSSKTIEPTELSLLVRWSVKPKLMGVPGVANVAIWGQRLRQMHVHFDPERLRSARIVSDDIVAAAGDALWVTPLTFLRGSFPGTGGWIDNRNQRLGVHHYMPIRSPEDMAKVPLGAQHLVMTGKAMALGDVAETTFSHPPLIGDAFVNNGDGLLLVVEKLPSANTLEVTRGVEQALAEMKLGLPGVQIDGTVFRLASYIEDSIANLSQALVIGALLVLVIVGAFFFNWRSAVIAVISIPLALIAAVIALQLTGATLNTMILAGLVVALGVVIDDAIVDMDKLMKRLRERGEGSKPTVAQLIRETTFETRSVAIYAALIVVLAVIPIFFLGGVSGAFFAPLALSYVLAVAASMLVALTVTPALSVLLFRDGSHEPGESPVARAIGRRFEPVIGRVLMAPRNALAAALVLVIAGAGIAPLLGQSLLPSFREKEVVVGWTTAPGTSWPETYRITSRVSRELQSLPGVRKVAAHVGRAVTGDQIVDINSSQIWVSIDPKADYDKTVAAIRETIDGYPGVDRTLQSYLRDRIGEVLTGAGNAIVVRIYGQNRDILNQKAEEVRAALAGVPGIVDLRAEGQLEEPQVQLKVNLDPASKANVKPGDVRRTAANVFGGVTVGFLYEDQKIYDVVVWGAPEARQSLTNLRDLWVGDRQQARLGDVADVSVVPRPTLLRHESIAPYVDVTANVSGRDLGTVADEIEDRLEQIKFPLEYHPRLLGEYAERVGAQERIAGVAIAAVIGIFLLLQACLRSWRLAVVAFLALPASLAGGVIAALVGGGTVSLGSLVGFLAALGIATRQGLLLINHYQRLERNGMPFGLDLAIRGVGERMTSIMASSAAIVAALLPLVVFGRIAGLEIVQPMAIVIIGGVLASTFVTVFVMPVLYLAFGAGVTREDDRDFAAA